jgi:RNA polymerase sigma-70 factor (ECF subfamily)
MSLSDARLVRAMGRGDAQAFESIYRLYSNDVYTVACQLLGNAVAAEDVLHDVFVGLARRAGDLKLVGGLRAYLVRACYHRVCDVGQQENRTATLGAARLRAWRDGQMSPEEIAVRREAARTVDTALAALPAEQREVVVLRHYGGLRFREIAEMLDASINTVQSRHRYALDALRQQLARIGVGDERN